MPLLKARIKDLVIADRESTLLTVAADSGSSSLTVEDNSGIAQNDLLIIGYPGTESAEIVKVTGTVTYGVSLTVSGNPTTYSGGTIFAHPAGTPIYRIDYDQVEFSRAITPTGSKTVLSTGTVQPDDLYTRYDDTANTTGYAFFRFKNSITSAFSSYSDAVAYGGYDPLSLHKIRQRCRRYLQDDKGPDGQPRPYFEDWEIDDAVNDAQRELAQEFKLPQLWKIGSMSSVANQREYGMNYLASDFWWLYDCTFNTQPQHVKDEKFYNLVNWNSNTTASQPSYVYVRNKTLVFWPTPSQAAQTTTLNGNIIATDLTITVASTAGLPPKGRIIIDSEVIEYDSTTATTLVLHSTEQRGVEGTTAASHSTLATVTARNILYSYYAKPATLVNETDITIFEDSDLLSISAASKLVYTRFADDKGIIDRFERLLKSKTDLFRKSFGNNYSDNFTRVKRKFENFVDRGIWPQVLNPQNLS